VILWWAVLAGAGTVAAVWLARGALASWREQRAGLVYELTPRYLGAALRGGAALLAFGCVLTGSVSLLLAPESSAPATLSADVRPAARPLAAPAASPRAPSPSRTSSARAGASSAASATAALTTIGRPHGGQLLQGGLPGLPGRFKIWLPGQYPGRTTPLQAVLVLADAAELDDVFQGLTTAVASGRSNPVVAVVPETACPPSGAAGPAFTGAALRRAVAARFHVVPSADGWGVLGLDAGAPCAVAAELAQPTAYRAAAGLGGRYGALTVPAPAPVHGPASGPVRLLLADAQRDTAGQASAAQLGTALARLPHAEVRRSSAVRDFSAQLERFRLVRVAALYLTEQWAASAR
jgi:hypothetical protein